MEEKKISAKTHFCKTDRRAEKSAFQLEIIKAPGILGRRAPAGNRVSPSSWVHLVHPAWGCRLPSRPPGQFTVQPAAHGRGLQGSGLQEELSRKAGSREPCRDGAPTVTHSEPSAPSAQVTASCLPALSIRQGRAVYGIPTDRGSLSSYPSPGKNKHLRQWGVGISYHFPAPSSPGRSTDVNLKTTVLRDSISLKTELRGPRSPDLCAQQGAEVSQTPCEKPQALCPRNKPLPWLEVKPC